MIRLLLVDHNAKSLTIDTSGFRACDPLKDGNAFEREYVVNGNNGFAPPRSLERQATTASQSLLTPL